MDQRILRTTAGRGFKRPSSFQHLERRAIYYPLQKSSPNHRRDEETPHIARSLSRSSARFTQRRFLKDGHIWGGSTVALTPPLRRGLGEKGSATALRLLLRSLPGNILIAIRTLSGKEAQSYRRDAS